MAVDNRQGALGLSAEEYNQQELDAGRLTADHITHLVELWQVEDRVYLDVDGKFGPMTRSTFRNLVFEDDPPAPAGRETAAKVYPLAKDAIFWSWQGEAHLRGFPMCFIRLAGCSVGCPECDTDYSADTKMSANAIASAALECTPESSRDRWAWITGGEPLDHDLKPLYAALRAAGFSICVATSGKHRAVVPVDWLSVSYHGGYPLAQRYGNEIKLIVGLNGLDPFAFLEEYPDAETDFFYRYVQPLTVDGKEDPGSLSICKKFLRANPNWALSRQDHVAWGVA